MKLITKSLQQRFAEVGEQRDVKDPLVICKFFNPCGSATWYAVAYYPEENICFGYVAGLVPGGDEWGYFSIEELEAVRVPPFRLPLERDLHFDECRFSELQLSKP